MMGLASGSFFSIFFCGFYIFVLIILLICMVCWFFMLIDILNRNENKFGTTIKKDAKIIWLLIVLLIGLPGALAYYIVVYRKYPKD